jgi:hypothetical protein
VGSRRTAIKLGFVHGFVLSSIFILPLAAPKRMKMSVVVAQWGMFPPCPLGFVLYFRVCPGDRRFYSYRNATIGSIFDARFAGMYPATVPTTSRIAPATANVNGSLGVNPNS